MNNNLYTSEYTINEFIEEYKQDIGIILGIVNGECAKNGFKINNKENLFKNIVHIIYINSNRRKLKL